MSIKLELPYWTSHHNMIIYSLLFYCDENEHDFEIVFNKKLPSNGAILYFKNETFFFDYSDNVVFIDEPIRYNYYFKRSLDFRCNTRNVYPLNFQVNYSYKALNFLKRLSFNDLINASNRIEIFRCMDYFNIFTNLSHNAMDARFFPKRIEDNSGKIIFQTRLWNPEKSCDLEEKQRREIQNEFRIEACRIIKNNFNNVSVGIFPDNLSLKTAPDLLLDVKKTSKKEYFKSLGKADIGIADDGLKDTPGWKVGEYLLFGKAVITTPLNTKVENFIEHLNYEKLSSRNSYNELPEKIEYLLSQKRYLELAHNNLKWSEIYLHPRNYIKRILSIVEDQVLT
ncbi:hypothetical protein [Flavobacterium luteolum]|uniref:hypothetical protein n=1 Tax=Flavobacterium luteolum TaxID=3003259 RepID=UPI00248EFC23|nr:hypothetical protein [Flavobacterium luteolum]